MQLLSQSVDEATSRGRQKDYCDFLSFVESNGSSVSPQSVASFLASRFFAFGWSSGRVEQARSNVLAALEIVYGVSWSSQPCIVRTIRAWPVFKDSSEGSSLR